MFNNKCPCIPREKQETHNNSDYAVTRGKILIIVIDMLNVKN